MKRYHTIKISLPNELGIIYNEGTAETPQFSLLAKASEAYANEIVEKLNAHEEGKGAGVSS